MYNNPSTSNSYFVNGGTMNKINAHSRYNRAARRIRSSQQLSTLIKDSLQEAEAELYINGAIPYHEELEALTEAQQALSELDDRLVSLMQVLDIERKQEQNPQYTEFDDLASMVRDQSVFKGKG